MNRDACGFSLSFIVHGLLLAVFMYVFPGLDLQPKPLVIDFSLIPESMSQSVSPSSVKPIEKPKAPAVVKVPPKPRKLAKIKPIAKVLPKVRTENTVPRKVLSRPVEKILPRKEEKVAQIEPLTEKPDPPESVKSSVEAQAVQAQMAAVETNSAARLKKAEKGSGEVVTSQVMEQQYVKAHFVYIKKIIEKNISYPPMARRMGWQGKVVVSFIVCLNGEVENLRVVESSGYAQLDKNALQTIKQVKPFPSPPVRVKLVLPVTYRMS